jgi:hypothetical protein
MNAVFPPAGQQANAAGQGAQQFANTFQGAMNNAMAAWGRFGASFFGEGGGGGIACSGRRLWPGALIEARSS